MTLLHCIIVINGTYDILCAFLALFFPDTFFANIHINIFVDEDHRKNMVLKRFIAYWLFTYGCIRVTWGSCQDVSNTHTFLVVTSYFIEAFAWWIECLVYNTADEQKVAFISWVSALTGIFILIVV